MIQPASGGPYTLSYSGAYSFPASMPQPTLSTAANDHDFITFVYNSSLTLWTCTGYVSQQNSGLVTIAQGGTGQTTAAAAYNALSPMTTTGDLEYESGTNTAARLAGNTSATKNFLTGTGTGSAANAPAWGTIAAADVPAATTSAQGAVEQRDRSASRLPARRRPGTAPGGGRRACPFRADLCSRRPPPRAGRRSWRVPPRSPGRGPNGGDSP